MDRFPNTLIAFQRMFPDEAACAAWLVSMRWPEGFECPRCGHDHGWALRGKAPDVGFYALRASLHTPEGQLISNYSPDGFSVIKGAAAQRDSPRLPR